MDGKRWETSPRPPTTAASENLVFPSEMRSLGSIRRGADTSHPHDTWPSRIGPRKHSTIFKPHGQIWQRASAIHPHPVHHFQSHMCFKTWARGPSLKARPHAAEQKWWWSADCPALPYIVCPSARVGDKCGVGPPQCKWPFSQPRRLLLSATHSHLVPLLFSSTNHFILAGSPPSVLCWQPPFDSNIMQAEYFKPVSPALSF